MFRKQSYTTNTVVGHLCWIRKVIKNKGIFPNDTAVEKYVYLAYRNTRKIWTVAFGQQNYDFAGTTAHKNWGEILFNIPFVIRDRYSLTMRDLFDR